MAPRRARLCFVGALAAALGTLTCVSAAQGPLSAPVTPPDEPSPATPPPAPEPDEEPGFPACRGCPWAGRGWTPSEQGYLNRWAARTLRAKAQRAARTAEGLDAAASWGGDASVLAAAGPVVELAEHGAVSRGRVPLRVLWTTIWAPEERRVRMAVGLTGRLRVVLNGRSILEEESDQYLLPDVRHVDATLRAGPNRLVVGLEKYSPYALRFTLRLRTPDDRPMAGLVLTAGEGSGDSGLCVALDPRLELPLGTSRESREVTARLDPSGLVPLPERAGGPTDLGELALRVRGSGGPWHPVTSESLALGGMAARPARAMAVHGELAADAAEELELQLALGDEVCATRRLLLRPELAGRLLEAEGALADWKAGATRAPGTVASLEHHAADVRRLLERDDADRSFIARRLAALERMLARAAGGRDPYAGETGMITRAYRSELDGTLQRYVLWVPPAYARPEGREGAETRRFPLIVLFHGLYYTPEDMLLIATGHPTKPGRWREQLAEGDPAIRFDGANGAILASVSGYGEVGQRQLGELDVLRVIDEVRRAYPIDERRVSMTGFSLGGTTSFVVPLHHPDIFSAAAPLCGYPNLLQYREIGHPDKQPWEKVLIAQRYILNYAANGEHLPLRMVHGEKDVPRRSELMLDRYLELGYDAELEVPAGLGHNVWDYAYSPRREPVLLRWLARRRAPSRAPGPPGTPGTPGPNTIVLRAGQYRYGSAWWLRIDRFADPARFGQLDGARGWRRMVITTRNVEAFTIVAAHLPDLKGEPTDIWVDGKKVGRLAAEPRDARLVRRDGRWLQLEGGAEDPNARAKRAGLEGPMDDIWFRPFIVVYGAGDPAQLEANRLTAEHVRRFSTGATVAMPVFRDDEVSEADLRGRGVVLVGSPGSNRWTRAAVDALPGLDFEPGALVFRGERYEGADVGISLVQPSAFDPDQYMVLHAGVGAEGTRSARHLPNFVPDYLIYDSRIRAQVFARLLDRRPVLAGGFFGPDWR